MNSFFFSVVVWWLRGWGLCGGMRPFHGAARRGPPKVKVKVLRLVVLHGLSDTGGFSGVLDGWVCFLSPTPYVSPAALVFPPDKLFAVLRAQPPMAPEQLFRGLLFSFRISPACGQTSELDALMRETP